VTFDELKAETFRRLQEVAAAPVFWTDADVSAALNEGYQEISDATEWYERVVTIDLLRERPYYDLRRIVPDPLLRVGSAFNLQTNRWLTPCSVPDLDRGWRRWETTIGEPDHVLIRGLCWLRYWPMNGAQSGSIQQHYTAIPPTLAVDADVPGFPLPVHYGLVEYALADLWAQDAETTLATTAWAAYLAYETALTDFVQGRVAVPMVKGLMGSTP
jgi:hypothetical protein